MHIQENISLKAFNTFGIDVPARYCTAVNDLQQLEAAYHFAQQMPTMVLGGGSNVLLTKPFDGLVVRNLLKGINVVHEDDDTVLIKSAAGENWHQFVLHCIAHGYGGVENLSLIPGSLGASPMQNIGAYGVEIKDVFHELEAWHIRDQQLVTFSASDCAFGYRESVFKRQYRGEFVIVSVTFRLRKNPTFNISYGAIQQELDAMGVTTLSIQAISDAVIRIRQSKLPDPAVIGNAGSFFKNPTISLEQYDNLKAAHPALVAYPAGKNQMKLAAGWLIEQCGWKGFRNGDAGCHAKQALVLVNYGTASGQEIFALSTDIVNSVQEKFGIELEREVNIV